MPEATVIHEEPRGHSYVQLIDFVGKASAEFSLAFLRHYKAKRSAWNEDILSAHFVREEVTKNRTEHFRGATAKVRFYRATPESCAVLKSVAARLFQWEHPSLPEDLCFYTANGNWVLATIAHERLCALNPRHLDLGALAKAAPELSLR